ncbi:ABC transporter substrate-binding protein [Clostridium perfringens]|uniref:ABC transporter substrate-binding protein n=1 Tax=Clostridium perfringens TaxID=1502 RepID=UPI0028E11A96|nr:ABC transporter substrate-binding protein [Clostridium perfringens]EHK2442115.1 peptide ABC transporter [Clostridium perfringens]MDT9337143.1 ABC transporter substrate-binding protein [Clostridium perfringens]MDT9344735.1 ABC transporter substrate-binding protein [Clostridium perfringens]MDT9348142.1 ABC transporter substrate-binding protein [Clostridium perfringens]MDT9353986.1 ABC transporter substrate-binding protein [Clostridium perfringens]
MKRKLVVLLTAGLAASMLFVACGGGANNTAQGNGNSSESGGTTKDLSKPERIEASNPSALPDAAKNRTDTLIVGTTDPKGEFVPIYSSTLYDSWVNNLIFDGLISNNEKGEPVPNVAESYEVSEDGKTYTFKLNKGIKFTNGQELTAKDVAFTFTSICDPGYDGPRMDAVNNLVGYEEYNKGDAKSVEGIKVIDDYTISFTNKNVDAAGIWNFSYGIMPESVYKFEKGNFQAVKDKLLEPVGSGAYKFVHFKPGQEVKFEKNPDYWKGEPKIPYIVMKVTNAQTLLQELMAGTVDIDRVGAKPENIDPLKQAGFLNLDLYMQNGYGYIGLNYGSDKVKDPKVRQALLYGLNRDGFMQSYYQGYGQVYNSHILPTSWAYNPDVPKYEYNPEKANQLLDEAGWKDTNGNGVRDKDGVELELQWLTYTGSKYVDALIPIVQQSWEQIGVKVTPELMEFGTMMDKVNNREYDIFNGAWNLSIDPDPSGIFAISQDVPGGFNNIGWRNEEADKLLKEGKGTTNQEERKKAYAEWQLKFSEDVPYILLGNAQEMFASNSRVKGYNPSTYIDWTHDVYKLELDNNK